MNYNNDINQFNNGNDKIPDAGNNLLRNFYENNENNENGNSNSLNNSPNTNNINNMNNMDNINNNLLNMANNIDNLSLDGLNLSNYNKSDFKIKDKISENNTLIKTLTKEIINNIKDDDNLSSKITNKIVKKKKPKEEEKIENFVVEDNNDSYLGNLINGENLKDFIIIFVLYFLLSQEMIKDFFGNYFTSLNPDDEGKVNVQGVIIYGLIFSFLFIIIKRLI